MHYLLLGIAALALLLVFSRKLTRLNPQQLASTIRTGAGIAAMLAAFLMAIVGRFPLAIPLAFVGFALLSRGSMFGNSQPTPGQTSRVRTAWLEMELDHDSGAMTGRVLSGELYGSELTDLDQAQLLSLLSDCRGDDPPSAQLLEAFLDHNFADWRASNQYQRSGEEDNTSSPMTQAEAYEVLGLNPGAGEKLIRDTHRKLMKKLHPDQGGSTYLATKINQAKDLLLGS